MGTRIGTIHANVTAKDLSWSETMRRVRAETKRTADLLQGMSDGVGGSGILPTIDIGNIMSRTVGMVTDAYRKLGEAREKAEIKADKAEVLGLTMAELQGLSVGAALANTSIETVTGATTKLIKKLSEAAEGSKEARADLSMLGLTIKDFAGLTTADALRLVADRLNQMQNAGDRANVAISLFGKEAGSKMITVLKGGAAAIDQYIKQARELGIVLSDAEIAAMRFANTQADINKLMAESMGERMSLRFGPEMAGVEDSKGWFKQSMQFAADSYGAAVELIAAAGAKAMEGGDLADIYAEGLRRRGILPMTGPSSGRTPGAVVGSDALSPELDAVAAEVDEWDKRLAENFRMQAERMNKIVEESWSEWIDVVDNPGFVALPGGGVLDLREQLDALKQQQDEQKKDQERTLLRDAEDLARKQMDLESAVSGRGGVAVMGRQENRRMLRGARDEQTQLMKQGSSAAERRVKENQRLESLTQQMLAELRRITANTGNSVQGVGV